MRVQAAEQDVSTKKLNGLKDSEKNREVKSVGNEEVETEGSPSLYSIDADDGQMNEKVTVENKRQGRGVRQSCNKFV